MVSHRVKGWIYAVEAKESENEINFSRESGNKIFHRRENNASVCLNKKEHKEVKRISNNK